MFNIPEKMHILAGHRVLVQNNLISGQELIMSSMLDPAFIKTAIPRIITSLFAMSRSVTY